MDRRTYQREWARTHRESRKRSYEKWSAKHKDRDIRRLVEWHDKTFVYSDFFIRAAKSEGCIDCGEMDPVVLEFDHVTGDKVRQISIMRSYRLPLLVAEIGKCEVRCANCHRRITERRRIAA